MVRLTHNLTDTPAVVSTDNDQMTTQMARLFAAAGQPVPEVKYTFELNPEHHLVKKWLILQMKLNFLIGWNCCSNKLC